MAKKKNIPTANKKAKPVALPKIGGGRYTPAPEGKKTVIQLGIGSSTDSAIHSDFKNEQWHRIRIDSEKALNPDILAAPGDLSAIPSDSADVVWANHILHKLPAHKVIPAIKEMARVLKSGGALYVAVPDAQTIGAYLAHSKIEETLYSSTAGDVAALDLLFGFRRSLEIGQQHLQHLTAFTAESLSLKLREGGFANIQAKRLRFEIQIRAIKYVYDDPARVERIVINGQTDLANVPIVPPLPAQEATPTKPTGYRTKPNMMFDELDQPPFIWKELKLKQALRKKA